MKLSNRGRAAMVDYPAVEIDKTINSMDERITMVTTTRGEY